MGLFGCSKGVKRSIKQILLTQQSIKELIMGIKEDFAAFQLAVNEALDEIQADIERLKNVSTATPPEVLTAMQAIQDKLTAIRNLDNPVPPVEEPPL